MKRETPEEIDMRAAEWAAKSDRGLSDAEARELDAWLSGDERHLGAFGRMQAVALQTERAAALRTHGPVDGAVHPPLGGASQNAKHFSRSGQASRRTIFLTGAAAASLAALGSVGVFWSLWGERYRTKKGEVRQVALNDGSVVTLNTASNVVIRFSEKSREIELLDGEALFDVAHDKARPFFVVAGTTSVRAVGTRFTVRHIANEPVQVVVHEGVVEVTQNGAAGTAKARVVAGARAVVPAPATTSKAPEPIAIVALTTSELRRALAWRDGRLAFEGETLAAAAAEFARYSDTRILVEDPTLASEEIAGLYRASDPVGFARSIAASLNARTEVSEGEVRIIR